MSLTDLDLMALPGVAWTFAEPEPEGGTPDTPPYEVLADVTFREAVPAPVCFRLGLEAKVSLKPEIEARMPI